MEHVEVGEMNYELPAATRVVLRVYNIIGQEVETLPDEFQVAWRYNATWNPNDLSCGMYFYRIRAGAFEDTKKILLLRMRS